MTMLHLEVVSVTERHLAAAATAYFGAPRVLEADLVTDPSDDRYLDIRYYLDLEVVETAAADHPTTIGLLEAAQVAPDAVVGDTLAVELMLEGDEQVAAGLRRLPRPITGLHAQRVPALRAAATELLGTDAYNTWIGTHFHLAPCAIAWGEMIAHPPGEPISVERAALIVKLDLGGVSFGGSPPRPLARAPLSAIVSSLGPVRIEQNDVRLVIPLRRLSELARPIDPDAVGAVLAARPKPGRAPADILHRAFTEAATGRLGEATLTAIDLMHRARRGDVHLAFVERRLAIRFFVLATRLLALARGCGNDEASKLILARLG
jgi:hypothetical protein